MEDSDFTGVGIENQAKVIYSKRVYDLNSEETSINREKVSNKTITKPIRTKIKMIKTDGGGTSLPNAQFLIFDKDDPNGEPLKPYDYLLKKPFVVTSDNNGYITVEKMPYLKEGYYFQEIKAPTGYRLPKALFHFQSPDIPMVGNTGDAGQYDLIVGSHTDANQIINVKKDEDITNTGTMGTIASLLGGGSVFILGLMLKKKNRLRRL